MEASGSGPRRPLTGGYHRPRPEQTGREVVCLPFHSSTSARHVRPGGLRPSRLSGTGLLSEEVTVQDPVADLVRQRKTVAALFVGMLVRIKALVDKDLTGLRPGRAENVVHVKKSLQVVEVESESEVVL